jgi:hypothetical protein
MVIGKMITSFQKIRIFTDSLVPFVPTENLNKIRSHLHALLCQFSQSLDDYGMGYVGNF